MIIKRPDLDRVIALLNKRISPLPDIIDLTMRTMPKDTYRLDIYVKKKSLNTEKNRNTSKNIYRFFYNNSLKYPQKTVIISMKDRPE